MAVISTDETDVAIHDHNHNYISPRAASIDSIKRLGSHLAESVVEFLVDEIESTGKHKLTSFRDSNDETESVNSFLPDKLRSSNSRRNPQQKVSKLRLSRCLSENQFANLREESDIEDDWSPTTTFSRNTQLSASTSQIADVQDRSTRQESAVLFVDISGFTKLSVELDIEILSKVINNYFEMIVSTIKEHGGDVLRFAGDALLVEWRTTQASRNDESDKTLVQAPDYSGRGNLFSREETVLMASLCASKLVNKLSDFHVSANGQQIATLNLHCGIGFGWVIGAHVGNTDRMEYLILGDTIRQAGDALALTTNGDVAVSPEVLHLLEESVHFQTSITNKNSPQIIASRSETYFVPIEDVNLPPTSHILGSPAARFTKWSDAALEVLRCNMSRYVHPVVLRNETSPQIEKSDRAVENLRQSEAELRQVFTLFVQPEMDLTLTENSANASDILVVLNKLMTVVNTEVTRFGGHLRQFIVDDKGLVLIANFGLQGSTFPNMIEERAMPLITNITNLLKTELNMACKMGATYGNAYCGVVGATSRHEYAVLGPSVNLAARLMKHVGNPGVLVSETVKERAGSHPFVAQPCVRAKGYKDPVKLFKPQDARRRTWKDIGDNFVGRQGELSMLSSFAESVISKQKSPNIVWISGPRGSGKSALLARSTKQIESICRNRNLSCHTACHVCCDDDSFKPFSIVRPIFRSILNERYQSWTSSSIEIIGRSEIEDTLSGNKLYVSFLQMCINAQVPGKYIEILGGLIFTNSLSDIGKWSDRSQKMSEWNTIARYFVEVLVHAMASYDFVLLALDDISAMDEMSWKILQLLNQRSPKLLVIGTSRNLADMNIDPDFWQDLKAEGRLTYLKLPPMDKGAICKMVGQVMGVDDFEKIDKKIARCVHIQSGGNPYIASEILTKLYMTEQNEECSLTNLGSVGELLLNRLDSLSPHVRLLLSLGAILGLSFHFMDIVKIMEQYRKVEEKQQKENHTEFVWKCLNEAVEHGILDETTTSDHRIEYTFCHRFWRENILNFTLDEWKTEMLGLIANEKSFPNLCTNLEEKVNNQFDEVNAHAKDFNRQIRKLSVSLDATGRRDSYLQQQINDLMLRTRQMQRSFS